MHVAIWDDMMWGYENVIMCDVEMWGCVMWGSGDVNM